MPSTRVPRVPSEPHSQRHSTQAHEKYEKELAIANEKIKRLQNECKCVRPVLRAPIPHRSRTRHSLLLDAVDIAVPGQPTLLQYLAADPIPSHYLMMSAPQFDGIPPPPPAEQLSAPQAPSRTHSQNSAPQTNGTNGHI